VLKICAGARGEQAREEVERGRGEVALSEESSGVRGPGTEGIEVRIGVGIEIGIEIGAGIASINHC
jgi:hypothetical protein